MTVALADGNDHQAAFFELIDERLRDFFRRARDDDLVEGRDFGPTFIAIAGASVDVFVTEVFERRSGAAAELLDDFDRVHFSDERAEDGRLITAAGADFEHLVVGLRVDGFGH